MDEDTTTRVFEQVNEVVVHLPEPADPQAPA